MEPFFIAVFILGVIIVALYITIGYSVMSIVTKSIGHEFDMLVGGVSSLEKTLIVILWPVVAIGLLLLLVVCVGALVTGFVAGLVNNLRGN